MFKKKNLLNWAVAISSACLFLLIYGVYVLDVTNTDWLLAGGDLSQHYLGWRFFRNASWQPLIGLTDHIAYPFKESVIFTDSIPLFSVIFKVFRSFLPEQFQFFGIWGLLCFVLQGILSANIIKKYSNNPLHIFLGSQLFVLAPVVLQRMFWHTSLAAHWIILLAIYLIIYQREQFDRWEQTVAAWMLVGFLCASVHIYYLPMCSFLLMTFVMADFMAKKPIFRCLISIPAFLLTALFTIWILGGFTSGMSDGAPGLGFYSFNLNGFYNPLDWSALFNNLDKYADGQYEGFAYLGAGVIFLLSLTVVATLITLGIKIKKHQIRMIFTEHKHIFCILAGCLLTILFAASPEISFNSKLLFKMNLPERLISIWAVFRSSGRMIWPVVYWLMIFAICSVPRYLRKGSTKLTHSFTMVWVVALVLAIVFQGVDLHEKIEERHGEFAKKTVYESPLQSDFWENVLSQGNKKHLLFADKDNLSQGELYAFSDYAANHNLTINNFYFARALTEPLYEVADDFMEHSDSETIYLFTWKARMRTGDYALHYYLVDDWIVGLRNKIEGYEELLITDLMKWNVVFDGTYVNDGEDEKGVRTLHPGGVSYGPYLELPPGYYRVSIQGDHLSNAYCLAYHKGTELYQFKPVNELKTEQTVIYEIQIDEEVEDIEFVVRNQSEEDIQLYDISLQYLP